jgi:hypothetical protein
LFFLFCFEEMAKLVHLFSPGWQDAKLIAFDQWLTGVNPSLWLERFAHPALNEFMQFAYVTYFVYLLIIGGLLYYQRDWKSYWAVMTYSAIAYVLGYVISMLFPVQSPWFAMAGMWHGELVGGPFTAFVNLIEKFGEYGRHFSQHVAGAVAALWGAWRHRRRLFWVIRCFVHVRFDGLCEKPLRGGCSRSGTGRGLPDWRFDDAGSKKRAGASATDRDCKASCRYKGGRSVWVRTLEFVAMWEGVFIGTAPIVGAQRVGWREGTAIDGGTLGLAGRLTKQKRERVVLFSDARGFLLKVAQRSGGNARASTPHRALDEFGKLSRIRARK